MAGTDRRRVTDAITLARLPIAVAMLRARRRPAVLPGLFALGVASDLLDGRLARRWGTADGRGARLDSLADGVFVAASTAVAATTVPPAARLATAAAASVVAGTRLANLIVTRRRFGCWSMAHTWLNKASGLGLAVVGGVALVRGRAPVRALAAVAVVAELAALDELAMALTASTHDADHRSVLQR
jgi:CDP-diacylglycerol--glycerol-3-phosphate 3-phosphatidyltransferase